MEKIKGYLVHSFKVDSAKGPGIAVIIAEDRPGRLKKIVSWQTVFPTPAEQALLDSGHSVTEIMKRLYPDEDLTS